MTTAYPLVRAPRPSQRVDRQPAGLLDAAEIALLMHDMLAGIGLESW